MTKKESFELYMFQGHPVLFTGSRIRSLKEPLPDDIKVYEIRHSDEGFDACQLSRNIWVNHYGTFLSIGEIDLGEECTIYFDEAEDMVFCDQLMTIDQYREMLLNQEIQQVSYERQGIKTLKEIGMK